MTSTNTVSHQIEERAILITPDFAGALLYGARPPSPHLLQFPILTDRAKWTKAKRDRLQTVPEEVTDRIEALQPFNRPAHEVNQDALVCLSWLNNIDKHRSNIAVNLTCNQLEGTVKVKWDEPAAAERNSSPRMNRYDPELADGAVLMEFLFQEPIASVQEDCSFGFVFTTETPNGKEELFALTDNLIQYVQQILDGLLGNYVKEDTVADPEIEGASEWRSGDKGEEGNTTAPFIAKRRYLQPLRQLAHLCESDF